MVIIIMVKMSIGRIVTSIGRKSPIAYLADFIMEYAIIFNFLISRGMFDSCHSRNERNKILKCILKLYNNNQI